MYRIHRALQSWVPRMLLLFFSGTKWLFREKRVMKVLHNAIDRTEECNESLGCGMKPAMWNGVTCDKARVMVKRSLAAFGEVVRAGSLSLSLPVPFNNNHHSTKVLNSDLHCIHALPSHLLFSYITNIIPSTPLHIQVERDHEGRHLPVAARRCLSGICSSSAASQTPQAS